ncbi:hypothetical protein [Acidisoma cladoniae]|uniref:hypothetical protein n=1 Tax=Acidisoma cladoniae TaxID=3040935 RepID=UPI00254B830B|nr:hypothetical protein [Acidisoma sp. PAMC 29798]
MTPEHRAWRLSGGVIETLELPPHPEWFYVPDITSKGSPVCLIPGHHNSDYETFTLPLIAEIACRLTPWSTWYLAPGFFDCHLCSGKAWGEIEVVVCRTDINPPHSVANAYHESWHLAEALLRPDLLAALDARLASGPAWPGDYYPQACERRARAFEHFAMLFDEGCRQIIAGDHVPSEIQLFWYVYSGGFGREIMSKRASKRAPRRSGILSRMKASLFA